MDKKLNAQLVSYLQQTSLVFRGWFAEFDAEVWDRQFQEDVAAGQLNRSAEQALQNLSAGRCIHAESDRLLWG